MTNKRSYKVKNARLVYVHVLWPHKYTATCKQQCLVCHSDGDDDSRGIEDGHPVRTSLVVSVSEDGTTVETLNSIYHVSSWAVPHMPAVVAEPKPVTDKTYRCAVTSSDELLAYVTDMERPNHDDLFALVTTDNRGGKVSVLLTKEDAAKLAAQLTEWVN